MTKNSDIYATIAPYETRLLGLPNARIADVWRSRDEDNEGRVASGPYFWTREAAQQASNGWGERPAPVQARVIIVDGRAFPLEAEVTVYNSQTEIERERALAKLTSRERELLGIK